MSRKQRSKHHKTAAKRHIEPAPGRSPRPSRATEPERLYNHPRIVPYARLDEPPAANELASDGTASALCRFTADPDELAYVVFDAEDRLGQMLLVVNARELPLPEQRLLETFLHYRRAVGEEPVELPEPSASSPAVGRVRSFDYVSCEPAFDGTRSILVLECGRTEAVLVTDSERTVIDRLCLDDVPVNPTTGRFPRAVLDFLARRLEVFLPLSRQFLERLPLRGPNSGGGIRTRDLRVMSRLTEI
jgi:hypothetical protein